jgi:hypothetical protein
VGAMITSSHSSKESVSFAVPMPALPTARTGP